MHQFINNDTSMHRPRCINSSATMHQFVSNDSSIYQQWCNNAYILNRHPLYPLVYVYIKLSSLPKLITTCYVTNTSNTGTHIDYTTARVALISGSQLLSIINVSLSTDNLTCCQWLLHSSMPQGQGRQGKRCLLMVWVLSLHSDLVWTPEVRNLLQGC